MKWPSSGAYDTVDGTSQNTCSRRLANATATNSDEASNLPSRQRKQIGAEAAQSLARAPFKACLLRNKTNPVIEVNGLRDKNGNLLTQIEINL